MMMMNTLYYGPYAFTISTELIFKHNILFFDSWITNSWHLLYSANFAVRILSISLTGISSSLVLNWWFELCLAFLLSSPSPSLSLSLSLYPRRFFDDDDFDGASFSGGRYSHSPIVSITWLFVLKTIESELKTRAEPGACSYLSRSISVIKSNSSRNSFLRR